jgi:hypothetical protein
MAVDTSLLLRTWLLTLQPVTTLIGNGNINGGIYCGDLPESFQPINGPCVQIMHSGGSAHPEIKLLADDKKMIRVWAGANEYLKAHQLYSCVYDGIHTATNLDFGANVGYMMRCLEVIAGQDVTDPDTGWATVVAFYNLMAR